VACDNLARFPAVTVTEANFETWRPPPGEAFDLVFAATAWHWIDPATRYQQAWTLLAPAVTSLLGGQPRVPGRR
jgi:trans-aconitate methyltransferase